jgi:serine protein kinase
MASSISPTIGIIEFIEMLKLDVAFLYDLLGASQNLRSNPRSSPDRYRQ